MTTLADVNSFGNFARGHWTTVWDSFWAGVDKGALTQAEIEAKLAATYERQFVDLAQRAADAASTAATKSDVTGAQYWSNVQRSLEQAALDASANGALASSESALFKNISKLGAEVAGFAVDGAVIYTDVTLAITDNNATAWNELGRDSTGILYQLVGVEAAMLVLAAIPATIPVAVVFGVAAVFAVAGEYIGKQVWDSLFGIDASVSNNYTSAQTWIQRRDPLTLDLDADGIETVGIDPNNPIYFDHDGDPTTPQTATGWIAPDDGFLALDRNGNGTIDSGQELFGDSTPLSGGGTAVDGFAALADLDSNADGVIDSNDTQFNNLRIWQDLNQNGISESNELSTLAQKNIVSINTASTLHSQVLADGNRIADLGSYTKDDGGTGTTASGSAADVDLSENTFYSNFTDTVPITPEAQALPNMQGSGQVEEEKRPLPEFRRLVGRSEPAYCFTSRDSGHNNENSELLRKVA